MSSTAQDNNRREPLRQERQVLPSPDAVWGSFERVRELYDLSPTKQRELIRAGKIEARRLDNKLVRINLPSVAYMGSLPKVEPGRWMGPAQSRSKGGRKPSRQHRRTQHAPII